MKPQLRNPSTQLRQGSVGPPVDGYDNIRDLYLVIKPQSPLLSFHDVLSHEKTMFNNEATISSVHFPRGVEL